MVSERVPEMVPEMVRQTFRNRSTSAAARLALTSALALLLYATSAVAQAPDPATQSAPAVDSALRIEELIDKTSADPSDAGAWTRLGILYIDENLLDDARGAFISALQAAPGEPSSHLNLALCLVRMQKWGEAQGPLQSFRMMVPEDVRGWALGGQALAESGDSDGAIDLWLEGAKLTVMPEGDRVILVLEATGLLLHIGDEGSELTDAELFHSGDILDAHATLVDGPSGEQLRVRRDITWLELASRQEEAGAPDQALQSWAHLRDSGSQNHAAWLLPVQMLLDEDRIREAKALSKEASAALPGSAIAAYLEGRIADAEDQPRAAAKAYEQAARIDPDLAGVWPALGQALAEAGDSKGAAQALAEAVKRGQGGATAAYNMGVVLNEKGQYAQAIPYLEDATKADPANRDAFRALGTAYRKKKRYSDALVAYQAILDNFGPDARDLYQLAYCEAKKGQNGKAATHYEMVTAMDARNVNAFYGLGNAASKTGDQDRAVEAYGKALELKPDFHGASFGWALALQKKGDFEGAIERYELTLELRETYSSFVNMAICYANLGDEESSDEYYALADELKKKGR
ncbi:hypothetical protein DRQ53_10345 [bacterium]|nr:MAG: hypothetical protein DRQ32_03850 [bacterium]RKZ14931.1 MAG: hypothetical protein DRQ53_10345 [bacterium]